MRDVSCCARSRGLGPRACAQETYDPWLKRTVDAAQKVSIDAARSPALQPARRTSAQPELCAVWCSGLTRVVAVPAQALGSAIAMRDIRVSYVDRDFRNIARRCGVRVRE